MTEQKPGPCPQQGLIEAFAQDKVDEAQRQEAETLLQRNETCREYFRQLTAGRYPRLPNYTIIGQIGKGGFGVVYKAVHHAKERTEALKVLFSKTPLLTEYFQNEVHLIAKLRHPHIATLFDAQLATPPLYYTMEFVEGERLNDYLKRPEVTLAERVNIIKTVALAVSYAHTQGVVHRDLKPQNILIDRDGQARVVDFGISIKLAEVGAPESSEAPTKSQEGPVGTLGYIAPEQEKGSVVDARADIFSLGALLFHSVTGEPARLATISDQRLRILHERRIIQPDDLDAVVSRAVATDPDDRYQTCEEFIGDLENYLTGRMIRARENPSVPYMLYRAAALVVRDAPFTVRSAILILMTGFLTWLFWAMETRTVNERHVTDRTVMVGFMPSTIEAMKNGTIGADLPGLDPVPPSMTHPNQSWRMLYGELLKKMAPAEPRVVLIDSYVTECVTDTDDDQSGMTPDFDTYLIDGLDALKAPVIIGSLYFEPNGEPYMCDKVLTELKKRGGYGAIIGGDTRKHQSNFEIAYCIQRGLEAPIPGLAIAGYAAWKYPDCVPELQIESDDRLVVKYRKKTTEAGEARYKEQSDEFDLLRVDPYQKSEARFARLGAPLQDGDNIALAFIDAHPTEYWQQNDRTLSFEQILQATPEQVRAWLHDRAIVIGQMLPGNDQHFRKNGDIMFGCQVHAEAIEGLMSSRYYHRFSRPELASRNFIWCGVGVILVGFFRQRRWPSLRMVTVACLLLFLLGVAVGDRAAGSNSDRVMLEICIALTGVITAGSITFLSKAAREHQLGLTPSAIRMSTENPTLASTVLAETR